MNVKTLKIYVMTDYQERMVNELQELADRKTKLLNALNSEGFEQKVGTKQYYLMRWQYQAMHSYHNALLERCVDMGIASFPECN